MDPAERPGDDAVTALLQPRVNCSAITMLLVVASLATSVWAQSSAVSRMLPVSKAQLEKILHSLPAYPSGKLPIVDGFVNANAEQSLDRYKRAYYQYSLQIRPAGANQVEVRVTAKITAWYASDDPAHAGYRVLSSNGRL